MCSASFPVAFAMLLAGMFCWGSWPSAYKIARNWCVELFHFDFSIGLFLITLIVAWQHDHQVVRTSLFENFANANRSTWLWAAAGGALMNAGNLMLVAAIRRVGMAVAFPISVGLSLGFGTFLTYLVNPKGNPLMLSLGVILILFAVATNSLAYKYHSLNGNIRPRSFRDVGICFVSGALFMFSGPMVAMALSARRPLEPLGLCLLYSVGSLIIAGPLVICFMRDKMAYDHFSVPYLHGSLRNHAAGLFAGFIWGIGMLLTFLPAALVGMALALAVGQADPLVAALWGILVWHEFRQAPTRARALLAAMFALYAGGLICLGLSYRGT
jgi:glucose uptake protein